jgi:hypothetical protein
MDQQTFIEGRNILANGGGVNELRNSLANRNYTLIDFSYYGMTYPNWSDNMFNAVHFQRISGITYTETNHLQWKIENGLVSIDQLIEYFQKGEPTKSLVADYCIKNLNKLSNEDKETLTKAGLINESVIFKKDLESGVIPFTSYIHYKNIPEKSSLINVHINNKLGLKSVTYDELKFYFENQLVPEYRINEYCDAVNWEGIVPKAKDLVDIPPFVWTNPVVMDNRTDVVLIGSAGAGKTMFLASLLKYCEKIGNLNHNTTNGNGSIYGNILTNAISNGRLITNTPPGVFLTMSLDFYCQVNEPTFLGKKIKTVSLPSNFIELPGEAFKNTFVANDISGIPSNISNAIYNENRNPKLYIFTIPVDEQEIHINTPGGQLTVNAQGFYDYFLDYLRRIGRLTQVVGIALVFTKWDKYKVGDKDHFINERCLNLKNQIIQLVTRYPNVKAAYFTHSLGNDVNEKMRTFTYEPSDMKEIYEWMTSILPYQK